LSDDLLGGIAALKSYILANNPAEGSFVINYENHLPWHALSWAVGFV